VAVHEIVVQLGVLPVAGLESFNDETRLPDEAKPVAM
jgi:hypothetical protein